MWPRLRPATTVPTLAIEPVEGVRGCCLAEAPPYRFADGCPSAIRARATAATTTAVLSFFVFAFADLTATAFSRHAAAVAFAASIFAAAFSSAASRRAAVVAFAANGLLKKS